jgi:hypothetical protein
MQQLAFDVVESAREFGFRPLPSAQRELEPLGSGPANTRIGFFRNMTVAQREALKQRAESAD